MSCLSKDNAVFNLVNDTSYQDKKFKLRCYACTAMYDAHVDFCKHCGYNTITRVSVVNEDGKEKILFKKNYIPKPKIIKNKKRCPDNFSRPKGICRISESGKKSSERQIQSKFLRLRRIIKLSLKHWVYLIIKVTLLILYKVVLNIEAF